MESNPLNKAFIKREDRSIYALPGYISNFKEMDMEVHPKDIILVNRSDANASEIQSFSVLEYCPECQYPPC